MKKLFLIIAAFFAFHIASAQTDNVPKNKKERTEKVSSITGTDSTRSTSQQKRRMKQKKAEAPQQKRERTPGTTGTIEYPDTQGAGTGTGNDTRIGVPPGKPEPGTEQPNR
jgi:hypothetical protein